MRLSEELRGRTKNYASAIIRFYVTLPREREEVRVLGKQLTGFSKKPMKLICGWNCYATIAASRVIPPGTC
jgi:hypothetical protein